MDPIILQPGQLITQTGAYALTMDQYHSQICDGPSISSSGLRTIWAQSPAHFYEASPLNPNRAEPEEKQHFSIGRAAHFLLLEGREGFDQQFAVRPAQWADWRTADARKWRADALKAGLTVITEDDLANVAGMARSLGRHPLVQAGILDGEVERSLVFRHEETGVWLKSRPDCIPSSCRDGSDLKTTVSVSTQSLQRTIEDYDYPMQGALVSMAFEAVLGTVLEAFTLVFVEKTAPWCVRIVTLTPEDMVRGRMQVDAATRIFAACCETGEWPGPGDNQQDAEYLAMREFKRRAVDERLEALKALTPATPSIREMELS
jgi:hypothetical protein